MHLKHSTKYSMTSLLLPARDVHEQNLQLFRSRDSLLYIRAIRDISRGETLRCWYEDSMALENNVPYLTPSHILGSQRYCCTKCQNIFAYPNVLKIHIMYHCKSRKGTSETPCEINYNKPRETCHQLTQPWGGICNHTRLCNNESIFKPLLYRFQKFQPKEQETNESYYCKNNKTFVTQPYSVKASIEIIPHVACSSGHTCTMTSAKSKRHEGCCVDGNDVKEVDIKTEEPMDVLSKSFIEFTTKDGHLCVYCGKLYSRKYGLKIHLRTHTGYKPLKCNVCFRAFGDPSNLNKHIRLHAQGSAPYQCMHCGKVLVRRRDLARHLKSRHPQK